MTLKEYINSHLDRSVLESSKVIAYTDNIDNLYDYVLYYIHRKDGVDYLAFNSCDRKLSKLPDIVLENIDVHLDKIQEFPDIDALNKRLLQDTVYIVKIESKRQYSNYSYICEEITNRSAGSQAYYYPGSTTKIGIIVGAISTDFDYYYVLLDEDFNFHWFSCVCLPDKVEEDSDEKTKAQAKALSQRIEEKKETVMKMLDSISAVLIADIWRGKIDLKTKYRDIIS